MVLWDKNRAQGKRISSACAFVLSASLGWAGLAATAQEAPTVEAPAAPVPGAETMPGAETVPLPTAPALPLPPTLTLPPATLPPAGGAGADAQPTGRVSKVNIVGNENITDAAIRAVISGNGLTPGEPYSAATAEAARAAVKNMGYFNGDVDLAAVADTAGGVDVTFTVKENPVVKTIKFTANTKTGEPTIAPDILKSKMDTKEGRVLNTNVLVRDLDKLFGRQNGYVASQGYIFDVSSDINIDPLTGVLNIPLVEAHINSITVKGNKKTKAVVVTRELHQGAGDVLNERKLQQDLTRVYNLGLFDEVGPFDLNSTDVGKVDIVIPVTEKRSGQVSVGVGYSSRSKLVGTATLAENNFRGMGERVSLQWQVGGVSSQSSLELGFFEPYLDKHHTSLDVDLFDKAVYRFSSGNFTGGGNTTTGSNGTYIERRQGGVIGVNRSLSQYFTTGITFRTENVKVDDVELQLADQFIRQKGSVTGLGLRGIFSNRDNDFAPAAGGLRSVSYELVTSTTRPVNNQYPSQLAPGRQVFGKLGIDLRQYLSLNGPRKVGQFNEPKRVLATRLLIGTTAKNIPFFEQYFLGGADSLRGYDTDRFWGSNLALVQAELRVPFSKKDNNIQGVLLFDGGDAWNSIYQQQGLRQHTNFQFSYDYGLGLRLVTPIGPIRLDYAIPGSGGGSGRTQFSIGQSF